MERILRGEFEIISSEAVAFEISRDPDEESRDAKQFLDEEVRSEVVTLTEPIKTRARELGSFGFRNMDALHLACAEAACAAWLLTTDDRLLRRAHKLRARLKVEVDNPAAWVIRFSQP